MLPCLRNDLSDILPFRTTSGTALRFATAKKFGHSSVGPLAGMKADAWEGGHRVPFVARWPRRIAPGTVCDQMLCFTDMLATFADSFRNNPMMDEMERLEREAEAASGEEWRADFQGVNLAHMEPEEMENVLADTVLKEFKVRLDRIGLEYQTPIRP